MATWNDYSEDQEEAADGGLDNILPYKKSDCAQYGAQAHFTRFNPDGTVDLLAAPCRRWTCTACAAGILIPRLSEAILRAIADHGLDQWITLTLPHDGAPDPARFSKKLSKAWTAVRNLYRKQFGTSVPCFWVKEVEHGWPHLHILTKGFKKKWLKREWHKRTGAQQVQVKPIVGTFPRLVDYALKNIPRNARRYGRECGNWWGSSRDEPCHLHKNSAPSGSNWKFHFGPIEEGLFGRNQQVLKVDRVGRPMAIKILPRQVASWVARK
jgi:hypothetical protein